MPDKFVRFKTILESPIANAYAVTTSDVADLPTVTRAVMVNNPGDLRCEFVDDPVGQFVTIKIDASIAYPFRLRKIHASGTTATQITGLY